MRMCKLKRKSWYFTLFRLSSQSLSFRQRRKWRKSPGISISLSLDEVCACTARLRHETWSWKGFLRVWEESCGYYFQVTISPKQQGALSSNCILERIMSIMSVFYSRQWHKLYEITLLLVWLNIRLIVLVSSHDITACLSPLCCSYISGYIWIWALEFNLIMLFIHTQKQAVFSSPHKYSIYEPLLFILVTNRMINRVPW